MFGISKTYFVYFVSLFEDVWQRDGVVDDPVTYANVAIASSNI